MPVSSLIFVVIVAIWAAYLVQHWARRREDAAASRSVEGFSEAMRVLEKRPSLQTTALSTPRPHSYAVRPVGAARPTVDVKRAVPAGTTRRHSPLVARRSDERVLPTSLATAGATSGSDPTSSHTDHDFAPNAAEVDRMPQSARQTSHGAHRRPGRPSAPAPAPARVSLAQRRIRAALLLVAVAWLPVSIVLTVTGVLMWVSIPFAVLTVAAVLVWLRAEAQADRLRTTGDGRAWGRRRHEDSDLHDEHESHHAGLRVPVLSSEDTQVIRSAAPGTPSEVAAALREADGIVARDVERGVFDVQAPVTGEVPVAVAEAAPAAEGSWVPVPVPRPTYALKAKAEPRYTETGIPADVFDTPEFADEADELDDRALFARRAVSQ